MRLRPPNSARAPESVNGAAPSRALLEARGLSAGYGNMAVVREVNLQVRARQVVALLGANGAGKTTTLLTLAGDLRPLGGEILWCGAPARGSLSRRARKGIGLVTEERSVFMGLTAAENLRVGRGKADDALAMFPELRRHLHRRAGLLSGGQQQMLSLGRALAARPRVLLADELSLGLAPIVVSRLLNAVRRAADMGIGVLLVEQHVRQALAVADYGYVLRRGRLVLAGPGAQLRKQIADIEATYLAEPVDDPAGSI